MRIGSICLLGLACLLGACSSPSHRINGTDVPNIPGTKLVQSSFKSSGGSVEAGQATFSGSIYDAMERARWAGRGFLKDGWTEVSLTGTPQEATAIFTAPWPGDGMQRVATLDITASQLRGSATITVKVEPEPAEDTTGSPSDQAVTAVGDDADDGH